MKRCVSIMIAVLVLCAGSALTAEVKEQAATPTTEKVASGTYIVYARSPQVWRVTFDPKTMANGTISGHFAVTAGTPKNLDVFVYAEDAYWKFRSDDPAVAKAAPKPIYASGRTGEGDVNVKLTDAGNYYLVLSNLFQYEGTKTVNADIKFQYDKH